MEKEFFERKRAKRFIEKYVFEFLVKLKIEVMETHQRGHIEKPKVFQSDSVDFSFNPSYSNAH